jgi:hypothetical protein
MLTKTSKGEASALPRGMNPNKRIKTVGKHVQYKNRAFFASPIHIEQFIPDSPFFDLNDVDIDNLSSIKKVKGMGETNSERDIWEVFTPFAQGPVKVVGSVSVVVISRPSSTCFPRVANSLGVVKTDATPRLWLFAKKAGHRF